MPKEFRFILVAVITVNYSVTILTKQFYDSSKIKCNGECIVELMDIMIEQFKDLLVNKNKIYFTFQINICSKETGMWWIIYHIDVAKSP